MAVGFDAATLHGSEGLDGTSGTFTFNHTVGAGSNRALYVCFSDYIGTDVVTGVTWDAAGANEALTEISVSPVVRHDALTRSIRVFRRLSPASGTKAITMTLSTSVASGIRVGAVSYDDVHQTTPEEDAQTATSASATSLSQSVTSTSGAATMLFGWGNGGTVAASTGTTNTRITPNVGGNVVGIVGDTLNQTAAAHSMAFTCASHSPSVIVISIKSATGGGGGGVSHNSLTLSGVG